MLKEVKRHWYNCGNHTVGVIECLDDISKKHEYFIGYGFGFDEQVDADFIIKYGAKFNPDVFRMEEK